MLRGTAPPVNSPVAPLSSFTYDVCVCVCGGGVCVCACACVCIASFDWSSAWIT